MIVVTGATGTVGRLVVDLLLQAGQKVTAITRDPATAELPGDAQVVRGDPSAPETLGSALDGAEAVLLSPRAVGNATGRLPALAADLRRAVVLSAATVEFPAGHPRFHAHFRAVEDAVTTSGLEWTFLRCADFAANALAWAPQIRATGIVRGAYGAAATSPVHQRDIAEVAVRALLDDGHAGRSYVLTGPQSLTQADKVRIIGSALGEELAFQEVSPEQVRQGMLAQGLPEEIPDRLLGSLADYAVQAGPTTDTVERLLGRPALTFADWAAEHAAAFRA
ncbi:NAD(P)H-binding protein [Streptosporangium longisporum]|uniref:NAD(P)H-binding protein n=1 Tax=Streptosporangium longisporum TaxID=46187 RepID=A0ABP6L3T2_9ACTN